ncbi:MAG: hypothetical protein U9P10_14260 [Thermodesulfobacteriota bacterium]|nr:hypothetical protein [Thermodesulfobacteriota bacterium]
MSIYLCYDIKGIQTFIFKVPKLKYIVGGSALIDRFDKETMKLMESSSAKLIFSGGGKGTFLCKTTADADNLKEDIIDEARAIGLDIRFGQHEIFSQAAQHADELYSFIPELHDGYPCPESGLYPTKAGKKRHPLIQKRLYRSGKKVFRRFEDMLLPEIMIPGRSNEELEFFHNVDSNDSDGQAGAFALGNRNRWAVISMDGNDMGMQFRAQVKKGLSDDEMQQWIQKMSNALDDITVTAASAGIQRVVSEWAGSDRGKEAVIQEGIVTLPIRPLVVGGDDIVVLCHCSYAVTFVKEVIRVFEAASRNYSALWPATNGKLTITAGILYSSVTLPLHTAIPYSEALLGSAKGRGRKNTVKGEASPSCIDWEQITDTVVDTPAAKRQREVIFFDEEIQRTVKLTQRPYTIEEFSFVENMADQYGHDRKLKLPRTVRYKIFPALQKGYAERLAFSAEVKKNHPDLFQAINEFDIAKSSWRLNKEQDEQSIQLIDALMLLEEDSRMEKETVQ